MRSAPCDLSSSLDPVDLNRSAPGADALSADALSAGAVPADALFASVLQRSDHPSPGQVRQAIAAAVAAYGDPGCAARVAHAFGEHPETAVTRMRWARTMTAPAVLLACRAA